MYLCIIDNAVQHLIHKISAIIHHMNCFWEDFFFSFHFFYIFVLFVCLLLCWFVYASVKDETRIKGFILLCWCIMNKCAGFCCFFFLISFFRSNNMYCSYGVVLLLLMISSCHEAEWYACGCLTGGACFSGSVGLWCPAPCAFDSHRCWRKVINESPTNFLNSLEQKRWGK